ncbi:MAG TPA: DUF6714 family protein, partial [Coleofasciculaceae cyanobacterium]
MTNVNYLIDQVRQEIISVFSGLFPPEPTNLIGSFTGDQYGEEKIRRELAGKSWFSLDSEFLKERWSSFCYLSAEGYCYYLPALLTNCLENLSEENELVHSTVFSLAPSYWHLYYQGKDKHFDYQISRFLPEQYGAVCSFLGLVFDLLPSYRLLSAKALKWGWNKQEHPALKKCLEFYHNLHHYQYLPSSDSQIRDLSEQIQSAFDETPYPGDDRLCGSEQGDEPAEYALEFRGLSWKTLHPDFLAYHSASLSFFTDEGFRYFLPAYLIADLMMPELEGVRSNADPVFHLTHGLIEDKLDKSSNNLTDNFDWYEIATRKFSHFNLAERKAIVAYLKYASA